MATMNTIRRSRIAGAVPGINLFDRRVEQVAEPSGKGGNTASSDHLFRNVTSQLLAVFRDRGCAAPIAEELAQKVAGEVEVRVREVLRRPGLSATWISGVIEVGDLRLDLERHTFWRGDEEIHLSPKEFDLLAFMMKNTDILLPHAKLLRSVWGLEYGGEVEYLRTYVCTLRKKIEKNAAKPEYVVNEPGLGYRFRNPKGSAPRFAPPETETKSKRQGTGLPGVDYMVRPAAVPTSDWEGLDEQTACRPDSL
jgi:DNA-binding winged helix-turn-helix (wHTH) protein